MLFSKRLERGRFLWPSMADEALTIRPAQLGYLLSGIDWRTAIYMARLASFGLVTPEKLALLKTKPRLLVPDDQHLDKRRQITAPAMRRPK
jgi:transposase